MDGILSREAANAIVVQTIREVGFEIADEDATLPEQDPNADLQKIQKLMADAGAQDPNADDEEEAARGAA